MTDLVIGSGPAGVSVATALLARGRRVLMLDGGATLEAEAEERRARMAGTHAAGWTADAQAAWQQPQFGSPPGQVRRYGSDFAMVPGEQTLTNSAQLALRASRAEGGLSNLWGAAVLPYRDADIADWPLSTKELAPHYRAVAEFMPISGAPGDLDPLLPAFPMTGRTPLDSSPQGGELLRRFARRKTQLSRLGVHAGAARLAVDPACKHCGQCLHGCPWGYIYSARHTLAELRTRTDFEHRSGTVRHLEESGNAVTVTLNSGETLTAPRVFVAAGVLETARLLLASRPGPGTLTLKDSQHFFLPSLHRWRAPRRPDRLPYHTLPQAFAEIADPAVSPHLVHSQIYTWNEFYAHDLMASYGARLPGSAPLWRALARRLIVCQVFLHSEHSARIGLTLAPDGRLTASVLDNPETPRVMAAAKARMHKALGLAGVLALSPASRPGAPGSSFHVGGSVPMAAAPGAGEADILGRPKGLSQVHVVDASILPGIPATTITFSVMANAHRIGTLAP